MGEQSQVYKTEPVQSQTGLWTTATLLFLNVFVILFPEYIWLVTGESILWRGVPI